MIQFKIISLTKQECHITQKLEFVKSEPVMFIPIPDDFEKLGKKEKITSETRLSFFKAYFNRPEFSDITLTINREKIYAHKIILSKSPYLNNMFTGGFKESNETNITLNGLENLLVNKILEYLYTGSMDIENFKEAFILLQYANYFCLEDLTNEIGKYIQNNFEDAFTIKTAVEFLYLLTETGLKFMLKDSEFLEEKLLLFIIKKNEQLNEERNPDFSEDFKKKISTIIKQVPNFKTLLDKIQKRNLQIPNFKPQSANDFSERGNQFYQLTLFNLAIENYSTAIELAPKNSVYYNNLGNAYFEKGDVNQAIKNYLQAIEFSPERSLYSYYNYREKSVYYNNLGNAYFKKGDFDQAIDNFSAAITMDSEKSLYYNNLMNAYLNRGDKYDTILAKAIFFRKRVGSCNIL